jgi:pilus assembly protein CpaE
MTVLFAMKSSELLIRLTAGVPNHKPHRSVHDREALWGALGSTFEQVAVHVELFADQYPWEWIEPLKLRAGSAKVVLIAEEATYDSLWIEVLIRLAGEAGFVVTPLGGGIEEAAREVGDALYDGAATPPAPQSATAPLGRADGVVAAVWSAACKDGATTVAVSTALALAKHTPLRVGLIDFNLKNPELRACLQLQDKHRSNASLRPKLQSGTLRPEELWEAAVPFRRTLPFLRVLPGTHRRDTAGDVTPEMMETLLRVARSAFDVTILDVSSYPDNAATVCAVRGADVRWLVAQSAAPTGLWSWREWYACYWKYCGLSAEDVQLVLNRAEGENSRPERTAELEGMTLAGMLPNVGGGIGMKALQDGLPLYELPQADSFAEAIHALASQLSCRVGGLPLPERSKQRRRNAFVTMLSGLVGP